MIYKKIPYGLSNFADLIENGYAYVDKTRYIELLENENNRYQYMLRPRRFGKSLFLSVLENYYDINRKNKFNTLFKNLYIGKNPTPEQGKYTILKFDFSDLNIENHELFTKTFSDNVQNTVQQFLRLYKNILIDSERHINQVYEQKSGIGALNIVYEAANEANVPVFIIIDEYDNFANNLIAVGKDYKEEVLSGGIVRTFYKSLKKASSSVIKRIFITGISPMMVNDLTSGFNMATDLSLFPKYNELFGFTENEVDWLLNETGTDKNLIKVDMESYYNGYMFNNDSKNKVYNSQMVLFLLYQIHEINKQPEQIVDNNLKTDCNRLLHLSKNKNNRDILLQIIQEGGIYGRIIDAFSLDELENESNFVSFLFYLGMLTCGGNKMGRIWLKIPNYSIKSLYWEYLVYYIQNLNNKNTIPDSKLNDVINKMAFDLDIIPYLDFFTENFLKRLSNRDLMNFNEKYIKVMMLSTLFMSSLYHPVSENENINGYTDIFLQKNPAIPDIKYEYIFELKYIKKYVSKKERKSIESDALTQINKYKNDKRYIDRNNLIFKAIIFEGKGNYTVLE